MASEVVDVEVNWEEKGTWLVLVRLAGVDAMKELVVNAAAGDSEEKSSANWAAMEKSLRTIVVLSRE